LNLCRQTGPRPAQRRLEGGGVAAQHHHDAAQAGARQQADLARHQRLSIAFQQALGSEAEAAAIARRQDDGGQVVIPIRV